MKFIYKIAMLLSFLILGKIATAQTALHYDGSNDYVNLGDNIEGLTNLTFETWIYYESGRFTQSFRLFS